METVKVGATTVGTYTYDYLGRRAKKVAGAVTTYYAYGANGLLSGEYSSTGTLVKEYVYLDSQPLAQIATGSPEVLTYLHTDHLGTPRYATNTAGASVWTWPSDAFGISIPTGTVTVNLRMPGQFYDSESGLFYNWNRYYNPNIGRYISTDPIGLEGGLNLFSYVGQSPIMASDILGLDPANDFFFGLMPAHTAQFMRNPIGGSVQTQLEYARQISQIRAFEASIALTVISANAPVSYIGSASKQMVLQCGSPDFIVSPGGTAYPIPKGSVGPIPTRNGGMEYIGGNGGNGLHPRVTIFRYSNPSTSGKYPYPYGRGTYSNQSGSGQPQRVNPTTGETISNSDPFAHIPGKN